MKTPAAQPLPTDETPAEAPLPSTTVDPTWLQEHPIVRELKLFGATFAGFTLRPRQFASRWLSEPATAMNPLTFMAVSAAAVGGAEKIFDALLPGNDAPESAWIHLGRALGPYVYYACVAAICHALLLPARAGRSWTSTVAMALFAGGSASAFVSILVRAFAVALVFAGVAQHEGGDITFSGLWALVLMLIPMLWFYFALGAALAGVHRVKLRWAALVVLVPLVATSFVSNFLPLPVAHIQVTYVRSETGVQMGLSVRSGGL